MRFARFFLHALSWSFLACRVASAQTSLSLPDAIHQAFTANPELTESAARSDEARGQRTQAGLAPNPRLVLQTEDMRFWGSQPNSFVNTTENYGYVGQIFETAGKRGRRVAVASSALHSSELEQDLVRRQIAARVSNAYWAAAGAEQVRALLDENVRTYEQDLRYTRNRVHEGITAEADLMRIQIERDRLQAQALTAARQADEALLILYRAMGKTEFPPITLSGSLETVPTPSLPEPSRVLAQRPELLLARQSLTEAEANVRLQQANAKPDPEAYVGYKRNFGVNTLYGAVQIDLPLRNRNQGGIASAVAQMHYARAGIQLSEANVRADLESAVRAWRDQQKLFDTMPASRARAQEVERLSRAAYAEGGIDLIRLLDAERSRIETDVLYYRTLVDLQQTIVNLTLISGEPFPGLTP